MNEFVKQRLEALREEIALYNEMGISPVKKLNGITQAVRQALDELTKMMTERDVDANAIAAFIRDDKPVFLVLITLALEDFGQSTAKSFGPFSD